MSKLQHLIHHFDEQIAEQWVIDQLISRAADQETDWIETRISKQF